MFSPVVCCSLPQAGPGCVRVEIKGADLPEVWLAAASKRVLELWEGILTK